MKGQLNVLKTTIQVGLKQPVKLLHITDTHITRDDPWGGVRTKTFDLDYEGSAEDYFFQALEYAKENNMPVLHTGDLIDFFSDGNFDFIDKYFSDIDYIYAAGNHDFCHKLGEAKEDYDYKWEKINDIAPHFKNNLYFDSKIIGGVNVVTLDDTYFCMGQGQLEMLKGEAAKGYPIILAMHIPLYSSGLYAKSMEKWKECAHLIGVPQHLLDTYADDKGVQQAADDTTLRVVEYIKSEPLIKAVIAGHTHLNFEEKLTENLCQYVTNGSFSGYVREITIV